MQQQNYIAAAFDPVMDLTFRDIRVGSFHLIPPVTICQAGYRG
jgi:hypothetical protein